MTRAVSGWRWFWNSALTTPLLASTTCSRPDPYTVRSSGPTTGITRPSSTSARRSSQNSSTSLISPLRPEAAARHMGDCEEREYIGPDIGFQRVPAPCLRSVLPANGTACSNGFRREQVFSIQRFMNNAGCGQEVERRSGDVIGYGSKERRPFCRRGAVRPSSEEPPNEAAGS